MKSEPTRLDGFGSTNTEPSGRVSYKESSDILFTFVFVDSVTKLYVFVPTHWYT